MSELLIPLASDKTEHDLQGCIQTNFCSWHRLKDYLGLACGLRPGERIVGVKASQDGIHIVIENVPTI